MSSFDGACRQVASDSLTAPLLRAKAQKRSVLLGWVVFHKALPLGKVSADFTVSKTTAHFERPVIGQDLTTPQ
jgi:hypothetical protein